VLGVVWHELQGDTLDDIIAAEPEEE